MKISYKELQKLIDLPESPEEIGKKLTSTGLEVEAIEKVDAITGGLEGIVIGEVLTCQKHPDADRLSITTVDVGGETPLNIVCGAPNVAAGQKVIVATVGATMYPTTGEPFQIKKSKIRGAASEGMICAEDEIGLGASHAGIMVLTTDLPNGTPATKYFNLEPDYLIEIGLTPNRADGASHYGVARDLRAVLGRNICLPTDTNFKVSAQKTDFQVIIENAEACPRFCGLEIRGVTVKDSPDWLKNFLRTIGVNSINNIVDITNYICHFLGQPMHIFDADEITGKKIVVRVPEKDTPITTLDGTARKLSGNDLAICNAEVPMAIAGVFGGENSGVKAETQNVFLEVAYFNPVWIRRTSTFHTLKTDASFRYERGTDPNMPPYAIKIAALMVQELAGGEIMDGVIDVYPSKIENFEVILKHKNINRLIGKNLDDRLIHKILKSLDIEVLEDVNGVMKVSVPPYRVDVNREADVIEEILRIYGFDNVELSENLKSDFLSDFPVNDPDKLRLRVAEMLAANGFNEIQTLSITKPAYNAALGEYVKGEEVKLMNPLSDELSVMRQSLLFSGLESVAYNINRRQKDIKFFEFGRSYNKYTNEQGTKYKDQQHLGVWFTGNKVSETWQEKSREIKFEDISSIVEKILRTLKISKFDKQETEVSLFQYGLNFTVNKKIVVSLGLLKKQHLKTADIKQPVFYAEFDWDYVVKQYSEKVSFQEISKFPEVRRDLSLIVDKAVTFDQIEKIAFKTERNLLKTVNLFDIYEGENLGEGKKAYSVSFILLDNKTTLQDIVIDKTMQRLIAVYEKEISALIRK